MKDQFLKIAGVKSTKDFYAKYPTEDVFFSAHPEAEHLKTMARGGQSGASGKQQQQIMQIIQAYAKASGADPRQIMQQLQQMQPQQQQQALQQMMQSLQGQGQGQSQGAAPQQQMGQPPMQWGGGLNHYDIGGYATHPYQFDNGGYYMGSDGQKHKSTGSNWSGNAFYADGGENQMYPSGYAYGGPTYEMAYGGYYQDGGQQAPPQQGQQPQGQDPQQIMQEIAQKLQQGEDPNQIIQELVQEGVPQDQAQQMVQQVVQQMQGQQGGGQQQASPDQGQGQPGMSRGGSISVGQTMDVTPQQAEYLKQMGYKFEKI